MTDPNATSDRVSSDTYMAPIHGWTCFHCGETLMTPGAARDHFGETPAEVPGCIIKAGEERGLLMALRRAQAERDEAIQRALRAEETEGSADHEVATMLRLVPGAKSSYDVRCHLHSLEGRVLAAEATLSAVAQAAPEVYQAACVKVCGPGTYYPPTVPNPSPVATL